MTTATSRLRRAGIGGLAALVTVGGSLVAAGAADATTTVTSTRVAGADRYETAIAISAATFPTATEVVVASGLNYPDALAAAAYAGKVNGPILLVDPTKAASAAVLAEITRLGATKVTVVGGSGAVSATTFNSLSTTAHPAARVGGTDRYATANMIADAVGSGSVGSFGGKKTAILATGTTYADALAAGAPAFSGKHPIFLTTATTLSAGVAAEMTKLGIQQVVIMGQTGAVSQSVEDAVKAAGFTTVRVGGTDRFETATKLASVLVTASPAGFGYKNTGAVIATGLNYADALAGGPHAGKTLQPLLFVRPTLLPDSTSAFLASEKATLTSLTVLGGTGVVADAVVTAAKAAAGNVASSAGVSITPGSASEGTTSVVGVTPETGKTVASIKISGACIADAMNTTPNAITTTVTQVSTQIVVKSGATVGACPLTVVTTYTDGTTATATTTLNVVAQAVNTTGTTAPELLSVTPVAGQTNVWKYQFDEPIVGQNLVADGAGLYHALRVYDTAGKAFYPYQATIFGDYILARFEATGANSPVAGTLARATVVQDAVRDATGYPNVEGAYALVPSSSTASSTGFKPQLLSVGNYRPDVVVVAGKTALLVDFTFDTVIGATEFGTVGAAASANEFYLVGEAGQVYQGNIVREVNGKVVTVQMQADTQTVPQSQLRRGVVSIPEESALTNDGSTAYATVLSGAAGTGKVVESAPFSGTSGLTNDPDLVAIERVSATSSEFRFKFDEAISDLYETAGNFYLYNSAGVVVKGASAARSAVAADNATVVYVTFAGSDLTTVGTVAGGFVADDAVRATDNISGTNTGYNRPAAVAVSNLNSSSTTQPIAGQTALADLASVVRTKNIVTGNYSVTVTVDQPLAAADWQKVRVDLYDAAGTRFSTVPGAGLDADATKSAYLNATGTSITFSVDNGFVGLSNEQIAASVVGGLQEVDTTPTTAVPAPANPTVATEGSMAVK